jgi:hypothetical protein
VVHSSRQNQRSVKMNSDEGGSILVLGRLIVE